MRVSGSEDLGRDDDEEGNGGETEGVPGGLRARVERGEKAPGQHQEGDREPATEEYDRGPTDEGNEEGRYNGCH